jgi:hypothetical protein
MSFEANETPATWLPIRDYRDFWDVPRMFLLDYAGRSLLFDCRFDEEREDYVDAFDVYVMPTLGPEELQRPWADLPQRAFGRLGSILLTDLMFDTTRRTSLKLTPRLTSVITSAAAFEPEKSGTGG